MVLLQGEPAEYFEWFKVDPALGNVRNQGQVLIEPRREIEGGNYKGNG